MDTQIACELNRRNVPAVTGRPWNRAAISRILRNENYIGNIVYNRSSKKLGGPKVPNPSDIWVRGEHCIEPIVEPEVFHRVGTRLKDRRVEIPEEEMLSRLRRLLHKKGRLSPALIENASGLPGVDTYIKHFGSIRKTYRRIGYMPERDYSFIDAMQAWEKVTSELVSETAARFRKVGKRVAVGDANDGLLINRKDRVLFRIAPAHPEQGHLTYWQVPRINRPPARWIVAIRLTEDNKNVLDYVLIPAKTVAGKYYSNCARMTEMALARRGFRKTGSVFTLAQLICRGCP